MTDTTLPWRILGRIIRPYALAVSLATLVVVWSVTTDSAVGELLDGAPGHMVGTAAALSVALLWAGWWARSDRLMRWGLFVTTGVWAAVGTVLALDIGAQPSMWLAWCWAVASGGAWLLETSDVDARRRTSESV